MQRLWLILAFLPMLAGAQDMVLQQGTVTVSPGTVLQLDGPVTWQIPSGSQVINDGQIHLRNGARMDESPGSPITGIGTEHAFVESSMLMNGHAPGGLGLEITDTEAIGPVELVRGHVPQTMAGGEQGIARWFMLVDPPVFQMDELIFRYDATELNGIQAEDLALHHRAQQQTYWVPMYAWNFPADLQLIVPDALPLPMITAFHEDAAVVMNEFDRSNVKVWPSITRSDIYIEIPDGLSSVQIEVLDATGRVVSDSEAIAEGGLIRCDVSGAAAGMLFIRLNGYPVAKIIKQ